MTLGDALLPSLQSAAAKVRQNQNMTFCSELFLAESRNYRKFEFWRFFIVKKKIEHGASQLNRAGRSK
jgi:hypothetical protein